MEINSRTNFEFNNDGQKERHYLTNGFQRNQKDDDGHYISNHLDNGSRKSTSISNRSSGSTVNKSSGSTSSLNHNDSVVFEHIVPGAVKKMWVMAESASFDNQQPEMKDEKRLSTKYGNFFISRDAAKESNNTDTTRKIVDNDVKESSELLQAKAQWGINLKPISSAGNKPRPKSVIYEEKLPTNETSNLKHRSQSLEELDQVDTNPDSYPIKLSVQQRMKNFEKSSTNNSEKYSYLHTKRPLKPVLGNIDLRGKSSIFYQPSESTVNDPEKQATTAKGKVAITLKDLLKQDEESLSVDVLGKKTRNTLQGQTELSQNNNRNTLLKNSVIHSESSEKPNKPNKSFPIKPSIGFEKSSSTSDQIFRKNQKNENITTKVQQNISSQDQKAHINHPINISLIDNFGESTVNEKVSISHIDNNKLLNYSNVRVEKEAVNTEAATISSNKPLIQNRGNSSAINVNEQKVVDKNLKEFNNKDDRQIVLRREKDDNSKTIATQILKSKVIKEEDVKNVEKELNNNEIKTDIRRIENSVKPLTQKDSLQKNKITKSDIQTKEQVTFPKESARPAQQNSLPPAKDTKQDIRRRVGRLIIMTGDQRDQQLKELEKLTGEGGMSNSMALENVIEKGLSLTFMSNEVADDDPDEPPAKVPTVIFNSPLPALKSILSPKNKKKKQQVSINFHLILFIYKHKWIQ